MKDCTPPIASASGACRCIVLLDFLFGTFFNQSLLICDSKKRQWKKLPKSRMSSKAAAITRIPKLPDIRLSQQTGRLNWKSRGYWCARASVRERQSRTPVLSEAFTAAAYVPVPMYHNSAGPHSFLYKAHMCITSTKTRQRQLSNQCRARYLWEFFKM